MSDAITLPNRRHLDLRIAAATHVGFTIWEGGEIVAALTSRAEVAQWLEERLGAIPGEHEREARDFDAMQAALANVERMPNVAQRARTEPPRPRTFFGR